MISLFRRYLDTWVVRGLFLVMVLAFMTWGVGDVFRMVRTATWVAKVGDRTIEGAPFQQEVQRQLSRVSQTLPQGQEITPAQRRQVGEQVLDKMVAEAALGVELQNLHVVTPDDAVREAVLEIPAFKGTAGKFSRQVFETVLRNNGLNEPRFLDMVRGQLAERQLLGAVGASASAPDVLVQPLFMREFEKRSADLADFPIAAVPAPQPPGDSVLQRWYANHPDSYSTPEYRRIKAIVLSPQTLAKEIPLTDDDLRAAYDQHRSEYVKATKRSTEVVSAPDQAKAEALAATWRGGADWAAVQQAAQKAGASAVALDDATETEFPDPALAKSVFAAAPDAVTGPVQTDLGWAVVKVTQVTPGTEQSFDQVKETLRTRLLAEKAQDLIYDRANKVDNVLGTGASLDELPSDLGLAGLLGTLDAKGITKEGTPAPIPGAAELRAAVIDAAFKAQKGDPARLAEVPTPSSGGSAYFALSVEDVIPPAVKPFDDVKQQVTDDWTRDAQSHAANEAAAKLLAAVKGGRTFADAATAAGVTVHRSPLVTSGTPADSIPAQLQRVLFGLKAGEPAMVETPEGFIVAVLAETVEPDPKADPVGFDRVRTVILRSVGTDYAATFANALRARANPRINEQVFTSIVQP